MKHKNFKIKINKCISIWSEHNSNIQLNVIQDGVL